MLSVFAIGHPGQRQVPLIVLYNEEQGRRRHASRSALTLRLLMSYIYIYIYIYIYMEHLFLMFLDHTQRRSTVGRTPLDE